MMTSLDNKSSLQPTESSSSEAKGSLEDTFKNWEREQLIEYAASVTEALTKEQKAIKSLSERYDATQNWALGLALVEEIGQNLASTLNLKEVLTRLLTRVYNSIDVEDGSVLLIEEPSGDLVSQVVLGVLSARTTTPFRVPRGQGIAGEVALSGTPVIVNDAKADPRHFSKIDEATGFYTRSILCVPIFTHEKVIGVLEVFNKKSGAFTKQDQVLLSSIANYAGIAIENARLHQSVVEERDRVIHVQEEVSHRLQRDLHDGPTQLVAAIQMNLEFVQKALEHNEVKMAVEELESMNELAVRASHQMRTLLFELRPLILETKGLVPALEVFLERRQAETDSTTLKLVQNSDAIGGQISRLETKIEAAIFAIVQEAVNNATKYAQADNIVVKLDQAGNQLTIVIVDDGKGFDVASVFQDYEGRGSYGMVNLRERVAVAGGEYSIQSDIGSGTEIRVEVPLNQPAA